MNDINQRKKLSEVIKNTQRCIKMKEEKLSFKDCKVKVAQYTLEGLIINKYDSLKHAETETSCNRKNISKAINGKVKSTGGFIWKRIE